MHYWIYKYYSAYLIWVNLILGLRTWCTLNDTTIEVMTTVATFLSGCFVLESYWNFNKMWFLSVDIIYQSNVISEHHNYTSSFVVVHHITLNWELGLGLALLDEILPNFLILKLSNELSSKEIALKIGLRNINLRGCCC